jgi:methyl acetate hydrolase
MSEQQAGELCEDSIGLVLREAVDQRLVPGVVAAVSDRDRTIYTIGFGAAQRRNGVALSPHSVFRIASMTKVVTSIAVLMLVEERRLDLDAPISSYLPDYEQPGVLEHFEPGSGTYVTRPAAEPVTIRQLLTHTSGYGYWFLDPPLMQVTNPEGPELYDAPFLMNDPGTRFRYSTGTDVLGQVIEPVSGLPLAEFFRRRIFEPLGMRDTGFERPADFGRLSSIFVRSEEGFDELPLESHGPAPRGGGGLYSTAEDYLKLLRLLLSDGEARGHRLLSSEMCASVARNQIGDLYAEPPTTAFRNRSNDFIFMDGSQKFGFGVAIESRDSPNGRRAGSYGWAGILNSYFWVDPSFELAAVILMQVQPFADPECVGVYRRFERALYDCLEGA